MTDDWSWPHIGCWLICGVATGASIGLAVEADWGPALAYALVATMAGVGATMMDDGSRER